MKKQFMYLMTVMMVTMLSIGFISCEDDTKSELEKVEDKSPDKIDLSYNYVYHHLEGRYVGTFQDLYNGKDTINYRYSGYVEIKVVPNTGNMKYEIMGFGGENIVIAGEYWLGDYDPGYDDNGEYGRDLAQIVFRDKDFWDNRDEILYWRLDPGYMWLHNLQMNLYFMRYVMGETNYNKKPEPRWYYHFVGTKVSWY